MVKVDQRDGPRPVCPRWVYLVTGGLLIAAVVVMFLPMLSELRAAGSVAPSPAWTWDLCRAQVTDCSEIFEPDGTWTYLLTLDRPGWIHSGGAQATSTRNGLFRLDQRVWVFCEPAGDSYNVELFTWRYYLNTPPGRSLLCLLICAVGILLILAGSIHRGHRTDAPAGID